MKNLLIGTTIILLFLSGCASSTTEKDPNEAVQLTEKCPIHQVTLRIGPGKLPKGMTVSWDKDVYAAMENYPNIRHDTWDSEQVQYCEMCEKEIDNVMDKEK